MQQDPFEVRDELAEYIAKNQDDLKEKVTKDFMETQGFTIEEAQTWFENHSELLQAFIKKEAEDQLSALYHEEEMKTLYSDLT